MQDASGTASPAIVASASIDDGVERQVDPRWIEAQRIGLAIFWSVVCGGSLLAVVGIALFSSWSALVRVGLVAGWLGVSLAAAGHAVGWPILEWRHLSYRLTPGEIRIRRGVWWRSVSSVPRSRVQHTDVSQGPIQRGFGLATLVIYTAGTQHASVSLDGLAHDTAVRIRDWLLESSAADGC
jgi:membrane protein YdbS with pleckstrin-like domain